jgi:hypothetical protein
MMLVGTTIRVSLLVAVGRIDGTWGLLLGLPVGRSIRGISSEEELEGAGREVGVADGVLTGASDTVPFVELGGGVESVGTSCSAELVDEGRSSDTGIPVDVEAGVSGVPLVLGGTVSVPDAVPVEGNTPEAVPELAGGSPDEVGRTSLGTPDDGGTSEGNPDEGVGMSDGAPDDAVGTSVGSPEGTGESVGIAEIEAAMLDRMLGIGTGAVPVGWIPEMTSDATLDTKLDTSGICEGRSDATEETKLEISEIKEGAIGIGVTPGEDVGAVGPGIGSVTPAPELGMTPGVSDGCKLGGTSETSDDRAPD